MSDENQNAAGSDLSTLLAFLEDTPGKLVTLISDLSDAELRWKHSSEEFSALENICHLRDLELQGYAPRIRRMLDETNPVLPDFDGARVAAESSYNDEAPGEALEAFRKTRQENVEKLRGLSSKQLAREGTLEGVGRITLKQLAEKMRGHDEAHLEDLHVLRLQLKRSPEIPKVLG
jgi:hypothetical protein